jgi:hypothetical protein
MGTPDRYYYLADETGDATSVCGSGTTGCYAYEPRRYWGPLSDDPLNMCTGAASGYIIVDVSQGQDGSELYAVNTAVSNDPNPKLLPYTQGQVTFDATVGSDGDRLTVTRTNNNGNVITCVEGISSQEGLFLAVGAPVLVDGHAAGWSNEFGMKRIVYPQAVPAPNSNENLAGTCMDSFKTDLDYTLAGG